MSISTENLAFEQRSDFIQTDNLISWNVENEHFNTIQRELKSSSIRLLVGPRGTGKTHQMKIFNEKCKTDKSMPLSIYISFTKYLHLEPYLVSNQNAIQIFHSWVLAKIILSFIEISTNEEQFNSHLNNIGLNTNINELIDFISITERGLLNENKSPLFADLNLNVISLLIEEYLKFHEKKRAVILFDDAALTLAPEFLIELFDIIRSIKSKFISPKASVYPGTTEYGPRFHAGQDFEEVICWMDVNNSDYSSFMDSLIDKRFSEITSEIPEKILSLFKYASFGIPRAFIGLINTYITSSGSQQSRYNKSLERQREYIITEFLSLKKKMPQFNKVISVGYVFFNSCVEILTTINKDLSHHKQFLIGIDENSTKTIKLYSRLKKFLYEAGLIYDYTKVSHGDNRNYDRFIIHTLFLLEKKAFSSSSRGFNPAEILIHLESTNSKHPARKTIQQILNEESIKELRLDFPPCSNCGFSRIAEEQLFCHNCGKELVKLSVFQECLKTPVENLSLTSWQKAKMKESNYHTLEDFLSQKDIASSLREIYGIGQVKAERISISIDSFVTEFLS